ncbi:uncharacterized protein LOC143580038 [Bidens hawaiensis]|uniref:uncharacterized protein LOC143580038 n=1 Tax=Bidens hawaiensis TaxID=980011 RepID=UPI004048F101
MPPSSLAGAPPSMDPISAVINLQTLPIANSNINELRSFSTALSEFISRYDELNNHITFINSSIDSKLPPNRLAEDAIVSVQNQNPSSSENTTFSSSCEEIDAYKKLEAADVSNNPVEVDVYENNSVEVVALEKPGAAGLSNNRLEVDVSENNYVEIDALEKPGAADLLNNRLEVDVSENNYVEINVLKKLEGANVFEIPIEINTLKTREVANNHVQIDTRGRDIDVCENNVEIDGLDGGFLHDYDESGVSKKPEVADVLKDYVGIDSLKKPEVADNDVEIDTLGRDIGLFKNRVEIDSLNSGFSHDYDESDVLKKLEVADVLKDHEEIDEFENRVEIDSLKKPEEIEVCKDPVEIDSLKKLEVAKNPVQIDTRGEIDVLENFEEVDVFENHVENGSLNMQEETVPESSCDETMTDAPGAVVSEQNLNRTAANGKQSNENVRTPECVVEIDVSVHKKHEQAGILKKPEQIDVCKNPEEIVVFKKHEEFDTLMISKEIAVSKKLEETVPETSCDRTIPIVSEQNPNELDLGKHESLKEVRKKKTRYRKRRREFILFSKNPVIFKLQSKCRNMSTKQLKIHVAAHYSEMINLREEIASALKLAEDPAKLVLRSIGRSFVTSSERIRMRAGDSHPQTVERMALVLILECFVMISSDGIEIARQDREYAAKTAVDWRKQMINEGGLGHTDEVDARGLLLLIGGFGIQDDVFTIQDIMDLIRASNVKGISTALRRSAFLIPKIPEVIYLMVKNNLEIEAVGIVGAFGLEDVCHPRNILTLHNKIKDIQNASPLQMEEAVPESSCDETMADAPGAVVSEQNRNRMAANGKQSNEQTDVLKKPEQIDICKNVEENVVLKKHEEYDTLMIQEEIVVSKKLEETIPDASCDRTIAIVSGKTHKGLALRTPESLEEVRNMKRKQVKDELLHKMKWSQMKKSRLEKALAKSAAIISALEKKKESRGYFDNLMIPEEIGTCKKPEESLPETSCDQTISTVLDPSHKKSVKQCLESHNVDPSTLLPDFKINERIQNLEKEVNEWKLIHKRKSKENPPIHHEPKRACVSHQNMPHQHRPPVGHYPSPQLSTSYITAHSASPGNTPGYYVQAVHMANGQPYGWRGPYGQHYPGHGQTYVSQPYHRPWEQAQLAQLALFPGLLGSRPPSSDLYRFADFVEKGTRGSRP